MSRRRYLTVVVAAAVCAASCVSDSPTASPATTAETAVIATTSDAPASLSTTIVASSTASAALPVRDGPREETTGSVPHIQTSANPVPEVDAELRRRAFTVPGIDNVESGLSLAGARALWLSDDVELARDGVVQGREIAHIHPDGSLHVWLPVERALEVHETKWGELHPWVERDGFWDGVVMIYTPENPTELDIVMRLLVESYNYMTGLELDPAAY